MFEAVPSAASTADFACLAKVVASSPITRDGARAAVVDLVELLIKSLTLPLNLEGAIFTSAGVKPAVR